MVQNLNAINDKIIERLRGELELCHEMIRFASTITPCVNCEHRTPANYEGYAMSCGGDHDYKNPRKVCEYWEPIISRIPYLGIIENITKQNSQKAGSLDE